MTGIFPSSFQSPRTMLLSSCPIVNDHFPIAIDYVIKDKMYMDKRRTKTFASNTLTGE